MLPSPITVLSRILLDAWDEIKLLSRLQKLRLFLVTVFALIAVSIAVMVMTGYWHDNSTHYLWYRALICGLCALNVLIAGKVIHRALTG